VAIVLLIGRILYALIFVGAGFAAHLQQTTVTAAYAEARGVKQARLLTRLSGVAIVVGGLGVMLGVFIDVAALIVVAFSLAAAFMVHHFWTDEQMMQQIEMSMFMKNMSMVGGGLILFAAAVNGADLGPTLTDPLFGS
jgi:uncharacterized membrane protein YphA (DoxX/SURF4 family)